MAHINLLPWREWERERRKNEFLVGLGGSVLLRCADRLHRRLVPRQFGRSAERAQPIHHRQDRGARPADRRDS